MFNALTTKLSGIFSRLGSRGILKEKDIEDGLREIRLALLEADVSLPVVREFMARVKEKALGETVIKAVRPDQQLVKIVYDELVALLGAENNELNFKAVPPAVVLMVGLQGSGKTTTSAKIALKLKKINAFACLAGCLSSGSAGTAGTARCSDWRRRFAGSCRRKTFGNYPPRYVCRKERTV